MKMLSSELDSFVLKFKSLWYSGIDAHLDVETHAGQAWVGLRVGLGHPPGLPQPYLLRKKDSPSKQRRRARRAEVRKLAADEAAVKASENVETPKEATKDNLVIVTKEVNDIKAVEETAETKCTGEVIDEFCRNAEYIVDSEVGAEEANDSTVESKGCANLTEEVTPEIDDQESVDNGKIAQVDGADEHDDPNYCYICKNSDEIESEGDLSYHMMNDHPASEVLSLYGEAWIENRRYCIRRGSPFETWFSTPPI